VYIHAYTHTSLGPRLSPQGTGGRETGSIHQKSCRLLVCYHVITLFTLFFPGIPSLLTSWRKLTAVKSELRPVSFLSLQFAYLAQQRKQTCRKLSCVHMISFYHSTRNLRREPGTKATHINMHKKHRDMHCTH